MAKHTPKSPLGKVLNSGDGGLSAQIAPTQPLPLLAQAEIPPHSSQSAQTEALNTSTRPGDLQSSSGKKPAPAESSGSTTPKSTLVGTLNWAVRMLVHQQFVAVEKVVKWDGSLEGYIIRLPAEKWVLTPENLLALKESAE